MKTINIIFPNQLFEDSYLLKAKFIKVGGIMIGNDVKMSGVKLNLKIIRVG